MKRTSLLYCALVATLPLTVRAQETGAGQSMSSEKPAPLVVSDAQWSHTISRGLPVHDLESAWVSVQLVCDPDRVFGPTPNGSFSVTLPTDTQPRQIVVLAETGEQAAFEMEESRIAQSKADALEWSKLVSILSTNTEFAVVSARSAVTWQVKEPLTGPCE